MSDPTEIRMLPNVEQDKIQAAIDNLKRVLPKQVELAEAFAMLRFAHFQAYKKAGFTEAQALELCTK